MRGFTWIGTANNNKTGQYYVMYGRKGIVTLYKTDKEFTEKKKTDMSFEMSAKGMIDFACEHKEMTFFQNLTR